jgi:DNA-binding response OmpR family regulator
VARILCVDDEPAAVSLKRVILTRAGHDVTSCNTAEDAIARLKEISFDAVVTDWRLGEDRGRAIVEAAKTYSSAPVVVVSGFVSEAFQAAEPLADMYLEKPVNPEELIQILDALLRTNARREAEASG